MPCRKYEVVEHAGIRYHDIEELHWFVERYGGELKKLGVRQVLLPEYYPERSKAEYIVENTLCVGASEVDLWPDERVSAEQHKFVRILPPRDEVPWFALKKHDENSFDVVFYIEYDDYHSDYVAVLAYNKLRNMFVIPVVPMDERTARTYLDYMRIAKAIAEGRLEVVEPVDPYWPIGVILLNWPVYSVGEVETLQVDTAVCRENGVDVSITGEYIEVRVSRRRSGRSTAGGAVHVQPRDFEYEFTITVRYGLDGKPAGVVVDGRVSPHPGVRGLGAALLQRLPELDLRGELCSQAAEIARVLEDVLSTPVLDGSS